MTGAENKSSSSLSSNNPPPPPAFFFFAAAVGCLVAAPSAFFSERADVCALALAAGDTLDAAAAGLGLDLDDVPLEKRSSSLLPSGELPKRGSLLGLDLFPERGLLLDVAADFAAAVEELDFPLKRSSSSESGEGCGFGFEAVAGPDDAVDLEPLEKRSSLSSDNGPFAAFDGVVFALEEVKGDDFAAVENRSSLSGGGAFLADGFCCLVLLLGANLVWEPLENKSSSSSSAQRTILKSSVSLTEESLQIDHFNSGC